MAPAYPYDNYTTQTITPLRGRVYDVCNHVVVKKIETKKEKEDRIAKERMFASWKTYNDKTETIKEIKQICKPRHKINHLGRRF